MNTLKVEEWSAIIKRLKAPDADQVRNIRATIRLLNKELKAEKKRMVGFKA
jgi:hypothetical protein